VPSGAVLPVRLNLALARLRALIRGTEIGITVLATLIGAFTGLLVGSVNLATQFAHQRFFALPPGVRLSDAGHLPSARALLVPLLGGALLGTLMWLINRYNPLRAVDPIEANALHGGRMSMLDSFLMVAQILISNSAGASVGLEAAYTQIGGVIASRAGSAFRMRRSDLRVLVGCGTAAAIASAFNAPIAGAFYAFELVIGAYRLNTLAPVAAATITAVSISQAMGTTGAQFSIPMPDQLEFANFLPAIVLGGVAALVGIAIMRLVTATEEVFRIISPPALLRPVIGGLLVGCLALISPVVMSGGHGALRSIFWQNLPVVTLAALFILKTIGSAVSLGSGFRGGLFFASLFLGALLGKIFALTAGLLPLHEVQIALLPNAAFAIIGMSALAAAIIGGPLTMTFLALETTANLPLTSVVLASCVASSLMVRQLFGYSFATWRFHLRGEAIKSPIDIGWIRTLTVQRLMRRDVPCVLTSLSLEEFCKSHPLGSTTRVIVVDEQNFYCGVLWLSEAHAANRRHKTVAEMMHKTPCVLYPLLNIKDALDMFRESQEDALAVVESRTSPRVLGLLNEHYALRRYAEELEKHGRELSGE